MTCRASLDAVHMDRGISVDDLRGRTGASLSNATNPFVVPFPAGPNDALVPLAGQTVEGFEAACRSGDTPWRNWNDRR